LFMFAEGKDEGLAGGMQVSRSLAFLR